MIWFPLKKYGLRYNKDFVILIQSVQNNSLTFKAAMSGVATSGPGAGRGQEEGGGGGHQLTVVHGVEWQVLVEAVLAKTNQLRGLVCPLTHVREGFISFYTVT